MVRMHTSSSSFTITPRRSVAGHLSGEKLRKWDVHLVVESACRMTRVSQCNRTEKEVMGSHERLKLPSKLCNITKRVPLSNVVALMKASLKREQPEKLSVINRIFVLFCMGG